MMKRTRKNWVKAGLACLASGMMVAWSMPTVAAETEAPTVPETAAVAQSQTEVPTTATTTDASTTTSRAAAQDPGGQPSPSADPTMPSGATTAQTVTSQPKPAAELTADKRAVEVEEVGPSPHGFGYDYVLRYRGDFADSTSLLLTSSNDGKGIVRLGSASVDGVELDERAAKFVIHPEDPFADAVKVDLKSASETNNEERTLELRVTLDQNEPGLWFAAQEVERKLARPFAVAADHWNTYSCRPGDVYTLTAGGRLALARQTTNGFAVQYVGQFPGAGTNYTHNALALGGSAGSGTNANRAYEVWTNPKNFNLLEVRRNDITNDWWKYNAESEEQAGYNRTPFVGGAMSPTATDSDPFYFGRFLTSTRTNEVMFQLYVYDPRQAQRGIWFLGNVELPWRDITPGSSHNGDIVLDKDGNLYLFWHTGNTVSVVPVASGDLKNALNNSQARRSNKYTKIPAGSSSSFIVNDVAASFNGAALDADGTFFVQWSRTDAAPWIAKYDPRTGRISHQTQLTRWPNGAQTGLVLGTDLASCQSFPTLELAKNLPEGRKTPSDQFALELWQKDDWDAGAPFLSATTEGTALNRQDQKAGPFPVAAGASYVLVERGAETTRHGDYAPSLKCDGQTVSKPLGRRENLTFYEITMPPGKTDLVSCEYSNVPQGTVLWQKTAKDTGKPLAGSEWVIRNSSGASYSVKDCEGDACRGGADGTDIDPRAGYFKVALPYGSYELAETKAPNGYRIETPSTPRKFTVSNTANEKDFGAIANPSSRATLTWQKIDAESRKLLAGSEWSLTRTGTNTETPTLRKYPVTITDCVAGDCAGLEDKNPKPGEFSLPNVDPGTYELVETKAPEGYVGGVKKTVTLTAEQGGTTVSIGDVENTRQKGSLTWGKIGTRQGQIGVPTDPTMLGGSEWTITPIQGQGGAAVAGQQPIVVEDCLTGTCAGPDTDARPGYFNVELPIGWYRVEETRAPLGYKLLAEPKEIQVTANQAAALGNFANEVVETPELPKTGGRGIGVPLAAGALIIALGALLGRRRSL